MLDELGLGSWWLGSWGLVELVGFELLVGLGGNGSSQETHNLKN